MSGLNTTCICYVTVSGCWRFRDSIARPSAQSFTKPQDGGQPGHVLSRRPDRGRVHRQTHSGTGRSHGLHRGWRAWCFAGCWWEATCSSQRPPLLPRIYHTSCPRSKGEGRPGHDNQEPGILGVRLPQTHLCFKGDHSSRPPHQSHWPHTPQIHLDHLSSSQFLGASFFPL